MVGVGGASTGLDRRAWGSSWGRAKKHGLRQDSSPQNSPFEAKPATWPWLPRRAKARLTLKITERLLGEILGDVCLDRSVGILLEA
jgi:hypothetical protein